ncbi:hypothetical protein [Mammaliicoccus sciuri]|uniref:hypothetical protein n=1 Tax=Mammaliicoccus sciuri TaxID=1296 RepID=UPI001FB342E5|nr:hypothetical protein [Mammaliicoccus sciuri]MCJ0941392.1 hypothetical protein [Mammaliicoccus sciuri]
MNNPNRIESVAVTKIGDMCYDTEKLEPYIPIGDKGLSYDGKIAVYKSKTNNVKNCIGTIPVQVKGCTVKRFSENGYKYDVKVDDLKLYMRDRGCFFFVVYIEFLPNGKGKNIKVFARQLHRIYINSLLEKLKKNQKKVTIEFYELAQKNLYEECKKFIQETHKHFGNRNEVMKLKGKKIMNISTPETLVVNARGMIVNELYAYSQIDGVGMIAVDTLSLEAMEKGQMTNIHIDGKCIDYHYKYRVDSKFRTLTINGTVEIKIDDNDKGRYQLKPIRNLNDYKKGMYILKHIAYGGEFKIGLVDINIKKIEEIDSINEVYNLISEMIEVSENYGGLFKYDFESDDLVQQLNEIKGLINLLKYKKTNTYKIKHEGIYKLKIDTHYVLLVSYEKNEFINYFSNQLIDHCSLQIENEEYYPFIGIEIKGLTESYNLNLNFISDIMKNEKFDNISEKRWNMLNDFCLRLIRAFDLVQNVEYLYIAQDILKKLDFTNEVEEFVRDINLLQIKYRINNHLENEDIKKLINYKKKEYVSNNEMRLLHVNTLIKSNEEALYNYENISEDEKISFSMYPMYYLFKENISN